jgi:hypothetical protein
MKRWVGQSERGVWLPPSLAGKVRVTGTVHEGAYQDDDTHVFSALLVWHCILSFVLFRL